MAEERILKNTGTGGKQKAIRFFRKNVVLFALVLVIVIFGFTATNFFTLQNLLNIGRQTALITIVACGMTLVIISANIDLSVGSTLAMAAMVAALTIQATKMVIVGVLAAILTGAVIGFVNGFLTTKARIPSFLATLGIMGAVRGLAMIVTETRAVQIYNQNYWNLFGDGNIGGVFPIPIIWTIVVLIIIHVLLRYSVLGRFIYATGGNIQAAKFTGVKTDRVIMWAFIITGVLAAFAGVILSSRMHAARPNIGEGLELNVIAAVILGGASLNGGRGTIIGTLLGALAIGTLNNGLILLGFSTNVQMLVRGVVIIAAVVLAGREEGSS
jgi:ribose/xylose/arabinose/galactoside ABC-type transport system permease subunit